jgi:hypothetical protein
MTGDPHPSAAVCRDVLLDYVLEPAAACGVHLISYQPARWCTAFLLLLLVVEGVAGATAAWAFRVMLIILCM